MQNAYFGSIYKAIRQREFCSQDDEVICNEDYFSRPRFFVGYLKVFSDLTETTLNSFALIYYTLHVVYINTTQSNVNGSSKMAIQTSVFYQSVFAA